MFFKVIDNNCHTINSNKNFNISIIDFLNNNINEQKFVNIY